MRLFVALNITEEIRKTLQSMHDSLMLHSTLLKVIPPRDYHVTVKFLGECRAGLAENIKKKFHEVFTPSADKSFGFTLKGMGVFPDIQRATVIWCGIQPDDAIIFHIYEKVEKFFQNFGFQREERPFFPHLTLARVRKGMKLTSPVRQMLEENENTVFAQSKFISLALYSSHLTPYGPQYKIEEEIIF
ncbi:MAG: RNA 2',3'-cyclic phosphodiesterase [Spirochaetes bacterium]|nr:RNA 2',3'-cyclic phosphodiesterase [Spirochaetota bacterium]